MRLVVIGGVAAGTKAASRARRLDPDLEVTIYGEEPDVSISECGLPYLISGVVERREDLVARTPEEFSEKGIRTLAGHRVEEIDPEEKRLVVRNLGTGETFEDSYDRLIVCTGAKSVVPPVDGADLDGVFPLRFLTDTDAIARHIREHSPEKAVVVGGGYIGLEVAENLTALGMQVSLVEAADGLARAFGPEVGETIEAHVKEKGVRVFTGAPVEAFVGDEDEGRLRAVRFGGREVEAEIAILGVGIRPEVALAKAAGAEIGETGAIRVNSRLKTSLPDVWAAGDCVESTDLVTGGPTWVPLGDTANQMGRVAGTNAALGTGDGGGLEFPGVLGTGIFKVFDLAVAGTGLSEEEAEDAGLSPVTAQVTTVSTASYYPGGQKGLLKLIAAGETGRLVGAEAVGETADKLVDICATAIWGRLSYPDLVNLDLAYAPPFGPALSPVIQAASVLSNEFDRREGLRATE
ncbi:hypothetical protein GBA65_04015 [Rubrobacter marinus]|uniref:Pyridine nucleotide-disulfide oxidoreductase n=1 Tax=Rubrobacter marinus TaxID=2653852 RepID=A0A6G8PTR4_9ACTN|nr:FAD-dependent oxidoreductase [Rubrobacter marinus]QIN77820.1 hypothetical protein GBA65_04015 [Rubrobacter marinus]